MDRRPNQPKWQIKNLLELKHARDVEVRGNRFSNNWAAAQDGFAFLLTVRNQDGKCTWCVVEDVVWEGNLSWNIGSAYVILGADNVHPSQATRRITIRNNIDIVEGAGLCADGRCLQMIDVRLSFVTYDHNTCIADGSFPTIDWGKQQRRMRGIVITNNIARHNKYGVIGTDVGSVIPALNAFFDGGIFLKNVLAGSGLSYPATNQTPSISSFLGHFVNPSAGDYRLKPTSSWRMAGTDGRDLAARG